MTQFLIIVAVLALFSIGGILWLRANDWRTSPVAAFDPASKTFAPCPDSPNCVSSQAPSSDSEHSIPPIAFTGSAAQARSDLLQTIQAMPTLSLLCEEGDYLHVEARSPLMRFVDDVEFYIDQAASVIQVRSASRLGRGDLGANRARLEEIRQRFTAQSSRKTHR